MLNSKYQLSPYHDDMVFHQPQPQVAMAWHGWPDWPARRSPVAQWPGGPPAKFPGGPAARRATGPVPVARAQAGFKQERSEDLGVARVEETQF